MNYASLLILEEFYMIVSNNVKEERSIKSSVFSMKSIIRKSNKVLISREKENYYGVGNRSSPS